MDSRTAIDLARGIIMGQNPCKAEEAFEILQRVSSNRKEKLHDIAREVVLGVAGNAGTTHFEP